MGAEIHRRRRRTRRMVKSKGPRTRDDKEQAISTRRTVISLRFHTSTRFIPRLSCQQEVGAALPERVQYLIVQNKGLQGQLSEVKRKQAESDCKKEEGQIQGQLNHSDASQYITQLQERISELKNEVRSLQIISEAHDRLQPPVEEDWEEEVKQSLPRTEDCENQSKDSSPYEPEDVVKPDDLKECPDHMQYQNLTHMEYIPALHHVSPVKWVSCVNRVVSGQFLDAEE
ncbi:uncharacterized protein LOC108939968 isoform X4 [Scleropages formosus]|uniref:uncharacterized protein LOC108939968 isoform X4 n=1 Tax=Scleropages formosus TaxID=113540 RepID=UPI0010FA8231|nr:uncharacterized protein LOC108939968 isoform X4 [Scleropages formosus]